MRTFGPAGLYIADEGAQAHPLSATDSLNRSKAVQLRRNEALQSGVAAT